MPAFWSSLLPPATAATGQTITITNVRATYIDETTGFVGGIGDGGLFPALASFSYDFATDTITAVAGSASGNVTLNIFDGATIVDSIVWVITITAGGGGTGGAGGGAGTGGNVQSNNLTGISAIAEMTNNISLASAFTGTANGTLILHNVPFNTTLNTLPDVDVMTTNQSAFTASYTPDASRNNGDLIVYDIHAKDCEQWQGFVNTLPPGQFGDTCFLQGNYYRYEWDGVSENSWQNVGGNPQGDGFTDHFSSIQFIIEVIVNIPPSAIDKTITIAEDEVTNIVLTATDVDGQIIGWSYGNPANGTLSDVIPGSVTYTPDPGYIGSDSFNFVVQDDDGDSGTGTVSITITEEPNFRPIAQDRDILAAIGSPVEVTLLGDDPDGDIVAWSILVSPENGVLSGAAPDLIYTPNANFSGTDLFTYTVTDDDDSESFEGIYRIRVRPPNGCSHMRVSKTNLIPESEIIVQGNVDTDVEFLKNEHRARKLRITDLTAPEIFIDFVFKHQSVINYFAFPYTNLRPDAEVQLRWYRNVTDNAPSTTIAYESIGQQTYDKGKVFAQWYDQDIIAGRGLAIIRHKHGLVMPGDPAPTTQPDGIPRQEATGILSMEMESASSIPSGGDSWVPTTDTSASGNVYMRKGLSSFYFSPFAGPRMEFRYTSSLAVALSVWVRVRSTSGTSIWLIADGVNTFDTFTGSDAIVGLGWQWRRLDRVIVTQAEQRRSIAIAARDHTMDLDKIVLQPLNAAAPTGLGPPASPEGTFEVTAGGETTEGESVELRMMMCGEAITYDKNYAYQSKYKALTDPDLAKSSSGFALRRSLQQCARSLTLDYPTMTDEDRRRMWELEVNNIGQPLLVSCLPDRQQWLHKNLEFLAVLENAIEYSHDQEGRHSASWQLAEV